MQKVGCSFIQLMLGVSLIFGIEAVRRRLGPARAAETVGVTADDVDIYLRVMRATVGRMKNPLPEDLAAMAAFERITKAPSSPASKLTREEKQIIQRAVLLTSALDEVVAQEEHLGVDRYRSAKAAVESVLPAAESHGRRASVALTAAQLQALKSKSPAVAPWAQEIRELQDLVWSNPLRQNLAQRPPRTMN